MRFLLLLIAGSFVQTQSTTPDKKPSAPMKSTETSITGKLIDADCHADPKCRVGAGTKAFGMILADGTFLKFDEGGNATVKRFLSQSARGRKLLRSKPGSAKRVGVRAGGTRTSDTFNLESIELLKGP
jgi:hypothetical protein